jgi:hypothetical protein
MHDLSINQRFFEAALHMGESKRGRLSHCFRL